MLMFLSGSGMGRFPVVCLVMGPSLDSQGSTSTALLVQARISDSVSTVTEFWGQYLHA